MTAALFGRDAELAAIDGFLAATQRVPAALVVEGQAGIGKTSLWHAALERAGRRALRLLIARPAESETKLSFASLADLLGDVVDDVLPQLPEPQRRALRVALLLEDPHTVIDPRGPATALLGAVRMLAMESPVVVAVDDAQWLDVASAEALEFVARRLGDAPVRVLLTQRRVGDGPAPLGLERSLPGDRLIRIRLGPLSLGAIHSTIHANLGVALPRPALLRVHEVAAGNPFFALELARALGRRGFRHDPGAPLPVPETLRALITIRLAELSAGARSALLAGSAAAEPTVGLVGASLGRDAGADLQEATARGIVELGDAGRIAFAHPLLASVIYEDAAPAQRRAVHRRLATVTTSIEERARHLALAADGPDPSIASLLDDAARAALRRGAPEAAAELSAQACALTPVELEDDLRRRGIGAARLYLRAGDTGRARELLEQLLPSCPPGEARGTARYLLGLALARAESHAAAVDLLEAALGDARDPSLRAAIAISLAVSLMQAGDIERAAPHASTAAALAGEVRDPALAAMALAHQAHLEFLLGRGVRREVIERARQLCARAAPIGSDVAPGNAPPEMAIATVLKWADEFDDARALLIALRRRAARQHEDGWLPPVLFQLAELECWRGDVEAAARLARETSDAALRAGSDSFASLHLYVEALVAAHRGEASVARERAAAGLEAAGATSNLRQAIRIHALLGRLALSEGDAGSAIDDLARTRELVDRTGYVDPGVFRFEGDHIEALVALGRLDEAEALFEPFTGTARALDRPSALAAAGRSGALILASRGDVGGALALLDAALRQHERVRLPVERVRTLLARGSVLRRAKRRAEARRVLEDAATAFADLGAALWAARARDELGRIGGRPAANGELTHAERRIAELVASGRSNKEIAGALFVTPKTVETQLSRIYAKLGIRSRVELARRVLGDQVAAAQ